MARPKALRRQARCSPAKDACNNIEDEEAALRDVTAIQLAEIAQHLQAPPAVLVTVMVPALRSMGGALGTSS